MDGQLLESEAFTVVRWWWCRGAFRKITLDIKERFMLLGINQGFGFKLSALLSSLIVRLDGESDSVHQSLTLLTEGQEDKHCFS